MSHGAEAGRTVIGRLRLQGEGLEPLSARLRLEALLGGAHLVPPGLPPSATVCIRRLMDPKPGVLSVRRHALRPPREWEEALTAALREQVARAARPALGAVPPGAEAVLFADPAELLACLASDVSRGTARAHWWWRGLFPGADLARTVVAEWLRQPESVPAALEVAAVRREAAPVLSVFTEDEARVLLVRVARVHGLVGLDSVREAASSVEAEAPSAAAREPSGTRAPWEPWVPEARAPGLGEERRTLLGVALTLRRAAAEARRESFVPSVTAWRGRERVDGRTDAAPPQRRLAAPRAPEEAPAATPRSEPAAPVLDAAEAVTAGDVPRVELPSRVAGAPAPLPPDAPSSEQARSPSREPSVPSADTSLRAPASPRADTEPSVNTVPPGAAPVEVATGVSPVPREPPPSPAPSPPAAPPRAFEPPPGRAWGLPITTGLGGVFYLVNLGLFLELYGDFSRPAHPHLPLPIWDFAALLGRRLLVDPRPSDAVWKVLALLSGRKAGEAPGQGFEPPGTWRLPEDWLRAFRAPEPSPWTWDGRGGRLRMRHAMGFLVLDVPRTDEDAEAQARRETEAYASASFTLLPGEVAADEAAPLERWLGWLVPYCRARLSRALGLALEDERGLETELLTHEARIHVTGTHVDVVLTLAQLPVSVRMAGLDRDIGWLPSAGRHLTFHFE